MLTLYDSLYLKAGHLRIFRARPYECLCIPSVSIPSFESEEPSNHATQEAVQPLPPLPGCLTTGTHLVVMRQRKAIEKADSLYYDALLKKRKKESDLQRTKYELSLLVLQNADCGIIQPFTSSSLTSLLHQKVTLSLLICTPRHAYRW